MLPIVETCRRLSLPVHDSEALVLPGLADFPKSIRVVELTPHTWATATNRRNRPRRQPCS